VERTKDPQDLALLEKLMKSEDAYERWQIEMPDEDNFSNGFADSYDRVEDNVMYVKIDDDIVSSLVKFGLLCVLTDAGLYGRQCHPINRQKEGGPP